MKTFLFLLLPVVLVYYSCTTNRKENSIEKWKRELFLTEQQFAAMAREEGISAAFIAFAAEDAVLLRNNRLIRGKDSLKESFRKNNPGNASLTWKPDFADVSLSGDLGYTYGSYVYTATDSAGNTTVTEGIFHTVWKRQADGTWKFVWD